MSQTENNNDRRQELLLLGQIHGLVQSLKDGQDLQTRRMDRMEDGIKESQEMQVQRVDRLEDSMKKSFDGLDERLREVEKKAAVAGAVSGGAVAVGTALVVEGIRTFMRGGSLGG